jgi:hypothetical protein
VATITLNNGVAAAVIDGQRRERNLTPYWRRDRAAAA